MMNIDQTALVPVHNTDRSRFEIDFGDATALLDYALRGNTAVMYHTETPPKYQGQGVAAVLTKAALDWARENGYRVSPLCSFVARYIQRHPEYRDLTSDV